MKYSRPDSPFQGKPLDHARDVDHVTAGSVRSYNDGTHTNAQHSACQSRKSVPTNRRTPQRCPKSFSHPTAAETSGCPHLRPCALTKPVSSGASPAEPIIRAVRVEPQRDLGRGLLLSGDQRQLHNSSWVLAQSYRPRRRGPRRSLSVYCLLGRVWPGHLPLSVTGGTLMRSYD